MIILESRVSEYITRWFIKKNIIHEEDFEVYHYGFKHILLNTGLLLMIGLIASLLNQWESTLSFFLGFMPLRVIAGGYHASTPMRCNLVSLLVFLCNLVLINFLYIKLGLTLPHYFTISIFNVFTVFLIAPVDHKNRTLLGQERIQARRTSRILVCCTVILINGMMILDFLPRSSIGILMGEFTASVFLIIGQHLRDGGEKYGNEEIR